MTGKGKIAPFCRPTRPRVFSIAMSDKLLYSLARPFLFSLDAEAAHNLTLPALRRAASLGLTGAIPRPKKDIRTVMGIAFPNPVGLAADSTRMAPISTDWPHWDSARSKSAP